MTTARGRSAADDRAAGVMFSFESEFLLLENLGARRGTTEDAVIVDYGSHRPRWFLDALFADERGASAGANGLPFDPESFRAPLPECRADGRLPRVE